MDDLTVIVRSFHLIMRSLCFIVGAVTIYPVLRYQMKSANGLKRQRKYIQGEMFSIAGMIITATVWQLANMERPFQNNFNEWLSLAATVFLTSMIYYGVKIVKFRYPEDQRERMGFGGKQTKKEE